MMKNQVGKVLYVGKAKNLQQRVKQYFVPGRDERVMVPFLISQLECIETIIVSSEKEALILENNLIKKHQPKYNVHLKDDKGYISIKVASPNFWPKIQLYRYKGAPPNDGMYFGPYTNSYAARQMFQIISRVFPLRQCSDEEFVRRKRPCLLYQIKRCMAPCVNYCTKDEYDKEVQGAIRFLRGQDQDILNELRQEMEAASENLEFEKAAKILNKMHMIESITEKQKVDTIVEQDFDAIGLYREGYRVAIAVLLYRKGKLIGTDHFHFDQIVNNDFDLLTSFILQHYPAKMNCPKEVLIPHSTETALLSEILSETHSRKIKVVCPQKGDKKAIIGIAIANAQSSMKQQTDLKDSHEKLLLDLQEKLGLSRFPGRIECFDNSHLAGSECVAAMVVFNEGCADKSQYRKYRIKTAERGDDYGMMREVLTRRYLKAKEDNQLPDLIVVDGGKGQFNAACKALSQLNITAIDVISIVKESGRHDKGLTLEKIYTKASADPIVFERNSPLLFFLQSIRDEAHRFAITFQKKRRQKILIASALDAVPGIGPIKKRNLLKTFGSVKAIQQSSLEELTKVPHITVKDAERILDILGEKD